jgi:hypothetical protein
MTYTKIDDEIVEETVEVKKQHNIKQIREDIRLINAQIDYLQSERSRLLNIIREAKTVGVEPAETEEVINE